MKIAVPAERFAEETRAAISPDAVKAYSKKGCTVTFEAGAGRGAFISDEAFREAGATIAEGAEAAVLAGRPAARNECEMLDQARLIQGLGPEGVLLKGGHGPGEESVDLLVTADGLLARLAAPRWNAPMRGTGCALSTAIAAYLAQGRPFIAACRLAKQHLWGECQP